MGHSGPHTVAMDTLVEGGDPAHGADVTLVVTYSEAAGHRVPEPELVLALLPEGPSTPPCMHVDDWAHQPHCRLPLPTQTTQVLLAAPTAKLQSTWGIATACVDPAGCTLTTPRAFRA